jgi:maltose alpha-D-glucosyltransferase/alpha-amylase
MLGGDRRRLELAYSLQFSLRGTPVLRYGEEIGMGDDLELEGRDAIRTPMQWESTSRGFSTAEAEALVRPMPTRGRFSNRNVNVSEQRTDPLSLLRWFGQLINEVRECPEISVGTLTVLDLPLPRSVIVHRYDAPEGSILLMHNLTDHAVTVDLSAVEVTSEAYTVFCDGDYGPLPRSLDAMHLNGWGYHWIRLRRGF